MGVQPEVAAAAVVIQHKGMINNNLIIFLKYPEPGKVKTRLGKVIGYENAADVYSVFIKHLLSTFADSNTYKITVYYSPKERGDDILKLLNIDDIKHQEGKNLGERLSHAFESSFLNGYINTIIIGTDCIELTNDDIEMAFTYLSGSFDSVIGPTNDGGYYLLGFSNNNHPYLFENIDWSTEKVFKQTIERIKQSEIKNKVLNYYNDIDEISDINSNVIKIINSYNPNLRIFN